MVYSAGFRVVRIMDYQVVASNNLLKSMLGFVG